MSEKWAVKALGDICEFVRGPFGGSLKKSCFKPAGYAVYEQQHAIYDQFEEIRYFIDKIKFREMQRFELSPGDLIMSCSGTMGRVAIVPEGIPQGIINQALLKLSPGKGILASFLKYWMGSRNFQDELSALSQGVAIKNIASVKVLKEIKICLPSVPEQKRIVAILDEAFEGIDSAIANTEKNLANARELFESYLNAIFTRKGDNWIEKPIDEISEVVSGYSFKSKDFSSSNSLKSIKITNVGVKEFIVDSGNYLPEGLVNSHRKFAVPAGSIVIALTRTIISSGLKVAVVPDEYHLALLNQRVAAIKADQKLMSQQFLFSYLCTSQVIEYVQSKVNTLMQPNLSINDLKKLLVPVPSLEEQSQIISGIEDLHKNIQCLEAIYQQKLAALNELKQSILQKAFSGELTAEVGDRVTQAVQETVAA